MVAGCSQPAAPAFPKWAEDRSTFAPATSSSNAFDGYVLAARRAEELAVVPASEGKKARDLAGKLTFTAAEKRSFIGRMAPAVREFRRASSLGCDYRFAATPPTDSDPNATGWRLIRNAIIWQLEIDLGEGDYGPAVELAAMATKAGFDLAGGGAASADVGLQFADDARRLIAPHIPLLGSAQVARLTAGMKRALAAFPQFGAIAENEKQSFMTGIDWIQSHYRAGTFDEIDLYLGSSVRDATTYLRQLKPDDREKRPAYFEGFAKEAEAYADWYRSQSALPVVKRQPPEKMALAKERPWRRYSASLFGTLPPILARYDATLARTRLMILTGEVYRQIKLSQKAPKSLDGFSSELATDPYSGMKFRYEATGAEFRIYSVGPNFRDDQGATDSMYINPDLTLETNPR